MDMSQLAITNTAADALYTGHEAKNDLITVSISSGEVPNSCDILTFGERLDAPCDLRHHAGRSVAEPFAQFFQRLPLLSLRGLHRLITAAQSQPRVYYGTTVSRKLNMRLARTTV